MGLTLLIGVGVIGFNSCVHPAHVLPVVTVPNDTTTNNDTTHTGVDTGMCFERDILPIFVSNCAKSGCHDAIKREKGYVLDNYNNIVSRGIVPGNTGASQIWKSLVTTEVDDRMPRGAAALTAAELNLISRWIAAGAKDSGACSSGCDSNNYTYSGAIAPMMSLYCTGCHNSAAAPGGSLKDYNSVKTAAVSGRLIGNISHQAGYNAMPPGSGIQLSVCQVTQVKKWVAAGALNN